MNNIDLNLNRNINFKTAPAMQMPAEQTVPDVQIPDLYYVPKDRYNKKGFKETIKQWDLMNLVYPWLEYPLLMLGTCFGLSYGVDKFAEACGGEYEKSLVGKAAKLGENIENSKFVNSKPFQTIWGWGKSALNKIGGIFKTSDLIYALRKTPSQPEHSMPREELKSMEQRVIHDFNEIVKTLKLNENEAVDLNRLHLGKKENEFLTNFFGDTVVSKEMKSNALQLRNIGLADDAIREIINKPNATQLVKQETLKKLDLDPTKLGMDVKSYFEKLAKGEVTAADVNIVREASQKARGINICEGYNSWLGPIQPFKRKIGLDEVSNRLVSMSAADTKSKLGRMLSSFLQKCHRGFTFGGSKATVLFFVTPFIVDTIIDVKNADLKEKLGTAVHGFVHSISWVFTFPLALQMMHHLGGMKYAGMSEENVQKCRDLIKEFNQKVKDREFKNYDEYKAALKILKEGEDGKGGLKALRAVKDQNLLTKIGRKIGDTITVGLEGIKPYRSSNILANIGRKIPQLFKELGGVPLRLVLWGCISVGVLDTIINKTIKTFFGNYYDRMDVEEHQANKERQKEFTREDLQSRLLEAQREKVLSQQNLNPTENNYQNAVNFDTEKATNLANSASTTTTPIIEEVEPQPIKDKTETAENGVKDNYNPVQKTPEQETSNQKIDNYTYIPSSENVIRQQQPTQSNQNKYIPSQAGLKLNKNFDNSAIDAALRRADIAEQKALQILAGNFNGM